MNIKEKALYTERPWVKWLSLALGLLQIWILKDTIQEYLANTRAGIFSPAELTKYTVAKQFGCVVSTMLITLFIGYFLTCTFAKSKWGATKANCAILVLMTGELGLPLLILRPAMVGMGVFWAVFSVITLLLTVYNVYHFVLERKKMQAKENSQQT